MKHAVTITQEDGSDQLLIEGIYGSRKARFDNPVEVGMAVLEKVLGQAVNPIPASCAIHKWKEENATG